MYRAGVYMKKILLIVCILILVVPALVQGQYTVGQKVDNFTLNDVNDNPVNLTDYTGKTVILYFFTRA